jgi:hypothetical protein
MTPTPDDRAKDICIEMEVDTTARLSGDDWATLERLIAQAIREAEDAARSQALEGAARCFEQMSGLLSAEQAAWCIRDLIENPPDWNLKSPKEV